MAMARPEIVLDTLDAGHDAASSDTFHDDNLNRGAQARSSSAAAACGKLVDVRCKHHPHPQAGTQQAGSLATPLPNRPLAAPW